MYDMLFLEPEFGGNVLRRLALFIFAAFLSTAVGCAEGEGESAEETQTSSSTEMKEPAAPALGKITGRWLRPDGGYVLVLENIRDGGMVTASYFNPSPIPVAESKWAAEGSELHVFVKFDHPNYPGSYYYLVYDPASDRLKGAYYQAVYDRTYSIEFIRQD
jgi:hypothetical protein